LNRSILFQQQAVFGLDGDDGGVVSDGAKVRADLDPDESVLAPVSSPGVSYDPVSTGLSVAGISSQLDAVIDVAGARGEDSTLVAAPRRSINAN